MLIKFNCPTLVRYLFIQIQHAKTVNEWDLPDDKLEEEPKENHLIFLTSGKVYCLQFYQFWSHKIRHFSYANLSGK